MKRWLALLLSIPCVAIAETPVVEVSVTPEQVIVGKPLRLTVKVLVPTWFNRAPVFPSFELPNAITRLPPDSAYPTSERVGGQTWSGIIRHYEVYPLVSADYEISDRVMRVSWADPGKPPKEAQLTIPSVTYSGRVPAGAETLTPFIAGHDLTLNRRITPQGKLQPGDALTIELSAELVGLPAMFIPPLWSGVALTGARAYPAEPAITDEETARRLEKITLILDQTGALTLPGVTLSWWDIDNQTINTTRLEPLTLQVGEPGKSITAGDKDPTRWLSVGRYGWLASGLIGLVIFACIIMLYKKRAPDPLLLARNALLKALFEDRHADTYQKLLRWLSLSGWQSSRQAFANYPEALKAARALSAAAYRGDQVTAINREALCDAVKTVTARSQNNHLKTRHLPPLNPTSAA